MGVMQKQEEVQETVKEQTKLYEIWGNQCGAESWRLLTRDTIYLPEQLPNHATGSVINQPLLQIIHQIGSETHPPSYSKGTAAFSSGVRWPEDESDRSSPSSAEVTKVWHYTFTPPTCFHGVHRDSFNF